VAGGVRLGQVGGPCQARHASCASQAEDRHAGHGGGHAQAVGKAGLQARRGDPGRGDEHDGAHVAGGKAGCRDGAARGLLHEVEADVGELGVAFREAVRLQVPFDRLGQEAAVDARVLEDVEDAGLAGGVGQDGVGHTAQLILRQLVLGQARGDRADDGHWAGRRRRASGPLGRRG
jgi:hypothetical protein